MGCRLKGARVLCLALIGALVVAWVPFANASLSDVRLMIRTDKTTYETGELVQIFVLLWNGGSTDVTLHFGLFVR